MERLKSITCREKESKFSSLSIWVAVLSVYPDYILSDLISFLTKVLGFSFTTASAIVNAQDCWTGIFGIVGAVLIDAYLTHEGMIFFSSLFYFAGLILLTGECYHLKHSDDIILVRWLVVIGLFLIAIGKSTVTNSANALSEERGRGKSLITVIQFTIKFVILVISTVLAYKKKESSAASPIQFLVPAILMVLVTVLSLFYLKTPMSRPKGCWPIASSNGRMPFLKPIKERGTPLKWVPRVFVAAILKCRLPCPKRFLDKAATEETSQPVDKRNKVLFTKTEVREFKLLLRMVPICVTFLAYGMIKSIGDTFFLDQGNQMDTTVGHNNTEIPLQAFIILAELVNLGSKELYKVLISKKLEEGSRKRYNPAIEYAMGMVLSTLCCTVASWAAMEVFQRSEDKSMLSVFWLTPQFILFGAMDGLTEDGIEGFFTCQLPPSMKEYDTVFTQGMIGAGALFAIILVLVTEAASNWISNEQENNRLDRFYHLLTVVGTIIFFGYIYVAVRYYYQGNEQSHEEGEELERLDTRANEQAAQQAIEIITGSQQENEQVPKVDSTHVIKLEETEHEEQKLLMQPANSTQDVRLERKISRRRSMLTP